MSTQNICFLDTETTGLHYDRQAWDVGIIRRFNDGQQVQETEHQFFVDLSLEHIARADRTALVIGGWAERFPTADGASFTPYQAAQKVLLLTAGATLVVNNPYFDVPMLERLLRAHGMDPCWHYRPIDVIALAAGAVKAGAPPYSSEQISVRAGVNPPAGPERHTALGDARWVRDLFDTVVSA